jgi:hypothetical protein
MLRFCSGTSAAGKTHPSPRNYAAFSALSVESSSTDINRRASRNASDESFLSSCASSNKFAIRCSLRLLRLSRATSIMARTRACARRPRASGLASSGSVLLSTFSASAITSFISCLSLGLRPHIFVTRITTCFMASLASAWRRSRIAKRGRETPRNMGEGHVHDTKSWGGMSNRPWPLRKIPGYSGVASGSPADGQGLPTSLPPSRIGRQ